MSEGRKSHWTILIAVLIGASLLVYLFSFQVPAGYYGVVYTFGEFDRTENKPGIKFKWPAPVQTVRLLDARLRLFDTKAMEVLTGDKKNVNLTLTAGWRIDNPHQFVQTLTTVESAEKALASRVDSARNKALQNYALGDLVSTNDKQQETFRRFEGEMKQILEQDLAAGWGVKIDYLGVKNLSFPTDVSQKVFERMKNERRVVKEEYLTEGNREATKIVSAAEATAKKTIAEAEAEAEIVRGQGDAEAARHYAIFGQNPELANYLRELKTLQKILAEKRATVVLNTETAPFRLLERDAVPPLGGAGK